MNHPTREVTLELSFEAIESPDMVALVEGLQQHEMICPRPIWSAEINHTEVDPTTPLATIMAARRQGYVSFNTSWDHVTMRRDLQTGESVLKLATEGYVLSEAPFIAALSELPFEIATVGRVYEEWGPSSSEDESYYKAPMWYGWHCPMGWAAAFKGVGHRRLVSRRWLDTGPWRLVHAPNDTSVVIFHDLEADAATALAQAKPGHVQIGNTEDTGFLQIPFNYRYDLGGLYDPATGALTSVVHGREPTPRELLEWAAIRANQRLGPERPIARVRFVFPEEARARALLPLLWRYGHECWAIIDGAEVRLDTDEIPPGLPRARP